MKIARYFFAIFGLTAFIFLCAFSNENLFEITVPKSYSYAYSGDSKSDVAKKLEITEDDVNDFFRENDVCYLAVDDDKLSQVRISVYEDDFSKQTENLSAYSASDIKKLAKQIVKQTKLSYSVCERKNKKYIKITEALKDSGGDFTSTRFLTVAEGKMFDISFYNSGKAFNEKNLQILDSFKIKNEAEKSKMPILITVAIAFGIAGFTAVIVLMVFGIYKERKLSNTTKKED